MKSNTTGVEIMVEFILFINKFCAKKNNKITYFTRSGEQLISKDLFDLILLFHYL
uniref:Uncharacterized protein n=1 Tax=Octopus bimaculoides TaxID=37653 RepID=A0A0L8FUT9_OCTBM